MKTLVKMILVLIMFIPLLVGAEECDISNVYIDSISVIVVQMVAFRQR